MLRTASAAAMVFMASTSLTAQQLRVRIVDDASRQPIAGVRATVVDAANAVVAAAETGMDGFAAIAGVGPGSYTLVVEHPGYAPVRQPLVVEAEDALTLPAILLKSTAVPLDTLEVEARGRNRRDDLRGPVPAHVLSGARLAQLERISVSGPSVIRQLAAGLRVRETGFRSVCVESTRRYMSMREMMTGGRSGGCQMVVVVLDGVVVGNGSQLLGAMNVGHYESIEYLPPVEAGRRYGMEASARGALVLWTRGFGPHRSAARDPGGGQRQTAIVDRRF